MVKDSTDKLVDAILKNEEENVKLLREIHSMQSTIQHVLDRNMSALLAIIFMLIIGVFALVNIKLQTPGIPIS